MDGRTVSDIVIVRSYLTDAENARVGDEDIRRAVSMARSVHAYSPHHFAVASIRKAPS